MGLKSGRQGVLVLLLALSCQAFGGETIFENFETDPAESGWQRSGDDVGFDHRPDGWLSVRVHTSDTLQRFTVPLGSDHDETQEFWIEFDWRSESVYEWPRAYLGVMLEEAEENQDLIGIAFQRRVHSAETESQRGVGRASGGWNRHFATPSFSRPSGAALDARTAVHYRMNAAGEGWMNISVTDLAGGEVLGTASGKVVAPGRSVTFDSFGISSYVSDSRSPSYFDLMRFDNLYFSTEGPAKAYFAERGEERPAPSWVRDREPPEPNPMAWSSPPRAVRATQVAMQAAEAAGERYPVEYFFENVTDPEHNSGWQPEWDWVDRHLIPENEYTYRVKARDLSPNRNVTGWSPVETVRTPAETDTAPPEPSPARWEVEPVSIGERRVAMIAEVATDPEGAHPVEYFFANLTDPARDSGWQTGRVFVDEDLDPETAYEYVVRVRDASANRNETEPSPPAGITTSSKSPLERFVRGEGLWRSGYVSQSVGYTIYSLTAEPPEERLHTIVYVQNPNRPRIGTEPDESILQDFIDEGFLVIALNFAPVKDAGLRELERALLDFHQTLPEHRPDSILHGSGWLVDTAYIYFLPEGYRLARNLPYWNVRDHGVDGTMDRIVRTYNGHVVENFGVDPVENPEEMRGSKGEEIDYNLFIDIIYPSRPEKPVPLVIDSSTNLPRMRTFGPHGERMIYPIGFTLSGYAWAVMDHCWNPLARREYYGYWSQYSLDAWNGLASATAAVRFLRAHAEDFGLDTDAIGAMGHSKGSYTITRLSDPDHATGTEHFQFSGSTGTSREPQPWAGESSRISVSYQSMGNGTRRIDYVTADNVPTIVAAGRFDQYGHWEVFPELVARYVELDLNHLALWMDDIGHDYPRERDRFYGADRYELVRRFFDGHLRPGSWEGPEVLGIFPPYGAEEVSLSGRSRFLPEDNLLPDHALDLFEPYVAPAVHFAGKIDPATVANGGLRLERAENGAPVPGTWSARRSGTMYVFDATEELRPETEYRVIVGEAIRDRQGNRISEAREMRFTTGTSDSEKAGQ